MERIYLECMCNSKEHLVIMEKELISDDIPELGNQICIYVSMDHDLPWYRRVINGFKYIFGIKSFDYSHYGDMIIKQEVFEQKINELLK